MYYLPPFFTSLLLTPQIRHFLNLTPKAWHLLNQPPPPPSPTKSKINSVVSIWYALVYRIGIGSIIPNRYKKGSIPRYRSNSRQCLFDKTDIFDVFWYHIGHFMTTLNLTKEKRAHMYCARIIILISISYWYWYQSRASMIPIPEIWKILVGIQH